MLALVDLYLCIHRILLHYLIKICVIIFFNIFAIFVCYLLSPASKETL